jgi:hypothetical protein
LELYLKRLLTFEDTFYGGKDVFMKVTNKMLQCLCKINTSFINTVFMKVTNKMQASVYVR